ncbi:hypothetical protein [Halostreptopolyspora alba]|uniref:hypothetical protein n=1 Tax=Halostreptopolyspora alba TaxID=2487137 RepID=UPI0011CDF8E9
MRSEPVSAERPLSATPPKWRGVTARVLMWCAAASAVVAAATGLPGLAAVGPDNLMAETWRWYGFLVFAALFALLAHRPLSYRWVWEIVIANKLLLTVTATGFASGVLGPEGEVTGAVDAAVADGVLVVVAVVAYVLCRGWRAGPPASAPG